MTTSELHGYAWIDPNQAAYKIVFPENAEKMHIPLGDLLLLLQMAPDGQSREHREFFSSKFVNAKVLQDKKEGDKISISLENNVRLVLTLSNRRAYEASDNPLPIEDAVKCAIAKGNTSKNRAANPDEEFDFLNPNL